MISGHRPTPSHTRSSIPSKLSLFLPFIVVGLYIASRESSLAGPKSLNDKSAYLGKHCTMSALQQDQEPRAREDQTRSASQTAFISANEDGWNGPSGQGSNSPLALSHGPINSPQRVDRAYVALTDVFGAMRHSHFDGTGGLSVSEASAPITTLHSPPEIGLLQHAWTNPQVQRSPYSSWGTSDPSAIPQVPVLNVAATSGMYRPDDVAGPWPAQNQVGVEPENTAYLPRGGAISLPCGLSHLDLMVKDKPINARFDSRYDICFLQTGAANKIGIRIRPIPRERQAACFTPVGLVTPTEYCTFPYDIPALGVRGLTMIVQLVDWDSSEPQIYLGRKLLAQLSSQGGAEGLGQANHRVVLAQTRKVNRATPCSLSDPPVIGDTPPIRGVSMRGDDIRQGLLSGENSRQFLTIPNQQAREQHPSLLPIPYRPGSSSAPWTSTLTPTTSFSAGNLTFPSSVTTLSRQAPGMSPEHSGVSRYGSCLDGDFAASATWFSDFGNADDERREEGSEIR